MVNINYKVNMGTSHKKNLQKFLCNKNLNAFFFVEFNQKDNYRLFKNHWFAYTTIFREDQREGGTERSDG